MSPPTPSPHAALCAAQDALQAKTAGISGLFAADPERQVRYSLEACGIYYDFSREWLDDTARAALLAYAQEAGLPQAINALFAGEPVNNTEARPALHMALRSPRRHTPEEQAVHETLARMAEFVAQVREGHWRGWQGESITDVVNIGIGGSDLGPAMVCAALQHLQSPALRCHFVSNVDPVHLDQTLAGLKPGRTLFIVASKSFTTLETSMNATAARRWVLQHGAAHADLARHFVAVSANVKKAVAFGIDADSVFPMWDWVGGRYSLWSAIGLSIALAVGMPAFRELLAGAHAMDEHYRSAPLEQNLPATMALLNYWYANYWGAQSKVILPYAQNLHLLPAFLQQLDMESLGKRVRRDGSAVSGPTGSILWGSAGTNGQHSFHQLLHQGSVLVPADFIAFAHSHSPNEAQHRHLLANCLAQSQALLTGLSQEEAEAQLLAQGLEAGAARTLAAHKAIPGSRPSSTLLLERLNPAALGALLALYEHKVHAHSILLGINAFDQWGVELGKVLGTDVFAALQAEAPCTRFDPSTNALVNRLRKT